MLKNKYLIYLGLILVGFIVGYKSKPARVIESKNSLTQEQLIKDLQLKVKTLSNEKLKENVKTVIVEKPDGTKVTTKTRQTQKSTNISELTNENKESRSSKVLKIESKTETINSENLNAIGINYQYNITDFSLSPTAYVQAGMKCFIFRCYVEGRYLIQSQDVLTSIGLELRF